MTRIRQTARERLREVLETAGWRVKEQGSPRQPDLVAERGPRRYAIELKVATESRKDRLIPLLSQAILQAQSYARVADAAPLAIVMTPPLSPAMVSELSRFAATHAADVAVGVIDASGMRRFTGDGLEELDADPEHPAQPAAPATRGSTHLFSDLNQWMLKVLLAPRVPETFLRAPRDEYRNVSELAKAAGVSVMSAFRFQQELLHEGFLDKGSSVLRLVRLPELFRLWESSYLRAPRDLRMRWPLPSRDPVARLHDAMVRYGAHREESQPRICLGLFAAADALGVGFTHGIPPHVYLERMAPAAVLRLGLGHAAPGEPVDVFVRQSPVPKSMFRGAIIRSDGIIVSDVLQILLDVGHYPARGADQAAQLRRVALADLAGRW
jgi:hypothetical protein